MLPDDLQPIAARYHRFSEQEAAGRSPLYEELTRRIAGDVDLLRFLSRLPRPKQQPNLFLAAVRHVNGAPAAWQAFRACAMQRADAVRAVMLARDADQ